MADISADLQKKYKRFAPFYDLGDILFEYLFYRFWRRRLWSKLPAGDILEVGVGTGKNIRFYPPGARVMEVDISPRMLLRAAKRAITRWDVCIEFLKTDLTGLPFDDNTFDAVVGTFVLMVMPDPLAALREMQRVGKPGSQFFFLEFTRSRNRLVASLQDMLSPLTRAVYHASLNRPIATVVENSGLKVVNIERVGGGLAGIIQAMVVK
jgi:ubiquinone/menaquinone biosynthesis C-methylase UbiE